MKLTLIVMAATYWLIGDLCDAPILIASGGTS
jgi:hypothetical protein